MKKDGALLLSIFMKSSAGMLECVASGASSTLSHGQKTENLLTSSAVWCREIALPSKGHSQKYLRFLLLVFLNSSFLVYGLHLRLESDKIKSYKTCFSEVSLLTSSKVKVIIQNILVFNSKINESKNRLVSSHSCDEIPGSFAICCYRTNKEDQMHVLPV